MAGSSAASCRKAWNSSSVMLAPAWASRPATGTTCWTSRRSRGRSCTGQRPDGRRASDRDSAIRRRFHRPRKHADAIDGRGLGELVLVKRTQEVDVAGMQVAGEIDHRVRRCRLGVAGRKQIHRERRGVHTQRTQPGRVDQNHRLERRKWPLDRHPLDLVGVELAEIGTDRTVALKPTCCGIRLPW